MMSNVSPIPEGYHTITPYLLIGGASAAIDFYKQVFGATEALRLTGPDGRIGHAELKIGTSRLMLADEHPEMDFLGPNGRGGTPVTIHLYVEDADAVFSAAVAAGAAELRPLCDQFYGDRSGAVTDPWGHIWSIASRIEVLTTDEIQERFQELYGD
jgi:PhnB protein